MKQIESFSVDHNKLLRGIYVSRKDITPSGDVITTFDIRMREPNREPVMSIASIHTNEHIGATFLRNHPDGANRTIYYGPMGCRTGAYVVFSGDLTSHDVVDIITQMFAYMVHYDVQLGVPGASAIECGNWTDHDLLGCMADAKEFYENTLLGIKEENLNYPQ